MTQSIVGLLQRIIPDFEKQRYERRKIRTNCKEIQRGIEGGGGHVYLNNSQDRNLAYLPDTADTYCVEADHLLKKYGSELKGGYIRIVPEDAEVEIKEKLEFNAL